MMTQKIEKSLSEINGRIAEIGEKQDKLLLYILGLIRHHIIGTSNSVLKAVQDRLSFIIALSGLGIASYALGIVVVNVVASWVFMICGVALLVYALIQIIKIELRMRAIEKYEKKTEDILSGIEEELKEYLTSEMEK